MTTRPSPATPAAPTRNREYGAWARSVISTAAARSAGQSIAIAAPPDGHHNSASGRGGWACGPAGRAPAAWCDSRRPPGATPAGRFRLRFGNGADDHCPPPSPDGGPGLACDHPKAGAWDLQPMGAWGRRRGPAGPHEPAGTHPDGAVTGAPEEEVTSETSFPGRRGAGRGGSARRWVCQAQL